MDKLITIQNNFFFGKISKKLGKFRKISDEMVIKVIKFEKLSNIVEKFG